MIKTKIFFTNISKKSLKFWKQIRIAISIGEFNFFIERRGEERRGDGVEFLMKWEEKYSLSSAGQLDLWFYCLAGWRLGAEGRGQSNSVRLWKEQLED